MSHPPYYALGQLEGNRDVIPTRDAPAGTHAADRGWKPRQQAGQSRNGLARGWRDLGAGGFNHLELTHKRGAEGLDRGAGVEGGDWPVWPIAAIQRRKPCAVSLRA